MVTGKVRLRLANPVTAAGRRGRYTTVSLSLGFSQQVFGSSFSLLQAEPGSLTAAAAEPGALTLTPAAQGTLSL